MNHKVFPLYYRRLVLFLCLLLFETLSLKAVWSGACRFLDLTHWGQVTHICVSELTIIGSNKVLSPGRRQAIIWNNAGLLLIEPLGTNVSEISIGIQTFSFKKMHLNMSSAKWHPFCLGLNALMALFRTFCQYLGTPLITMLIGSSITDELNREIFVLLLKYEWLFGYMLVCYVD